MARLPRNQAPSRPRSARLAVFDAFRVEGALLQPEMLDRIVNLGATAQEVSDYELDKGEKLRDVVTTKFALAQSLHARFVNSDMGQQACRRFLTAFFTQVLEFTDLQDAPPRTVDGGSYPISHHALSGRVPIVLAPPGKLDEALPAFGDGARRRSAPQLLQEYLNAEPSSLWGIACDGFSLRLYRDNNALTRPAYIEADLFHIFEADAPRLSDFSALWLVAHASRFGRPGTPATESSLERWREEGLKQGATAREELKKGVEKALKDLGLGLIEHPQNEKLRTELGNGSLPPQAFLQALLRLIYRFIFVLTVEDRGVLHSLPPDDDREFEAWRRGKAAYAKGYSLGRLRDQATKRQFRNRHSDAWQGVLILIRELWRGQKLLALPALGGLFARSEVREFDDCLISNEHLFKALRHLGWLDTPSGLQRVNWRDMETEELGSVYESLLELTPKLFGSPKFDLVTAAGNDRKTTASYYTPDSLVQALLDETLDPLTEETVKDKSPDEAAAALLSLRIIDPACGSGHFLLAAARRLATRIAAIKSTGAPSPGDYRHWMREVARHCLFGVDRNPMAVELAKVALWIETVEPNKPLSFLDAHIRCGDSLLGVYDLATLKKGIPDEAYSPLAGDDKLAARAWRDRNRAEREARAQGQLAFFEPPRDVLDAARAIESQEEDELAAVEAKAAAHRALMSADGRYRLETACDLYVAAYLLPKTKAPVLVGAQEEWIPTTAEVWRMAEGGQPHGLLVGRAVDAAKVARAFHWPLEFPQVYFPGPDRKAGFDLVIGNPPWETMSPDAKEYFSRYGAQVRFMSPADQQTRIAEILNAPGVQEEWDAHCHHLYASAQFFKESGRYKLFAEGNLGKGDFNIYRMFVELALTLIREGGRAAQFVPENLYNGANASAIRAHLLEKCQLHALVGFENTQKVWFEIDSRAKFCLYVASREGPTKSFRAAFGINTRAKLAALRASFPLSVPVALVREFSPEALTVAEVIHPADLEVSRKMYDRYPKFGDESEGPSPRTYMREIDMGSDREMFVAGADGIPVFEGRMVEHFDYRAKAYVSGRGRSAVWRELEFGQPDKAIIPQWRIKVSDIPEKLGDRWQNYRLGFCDVGGVTNWRFLMATLIPPDVVCGHSVPTITLEPADPRLAMLWLGVTNSFCLDFLARKRAGLHMTFTVLDSLPLPRVYLDTPLDRAIARRALRLAAVGDEMTAYWNAAAPSLGLNPEQIAPASQTAERVSLRAELDVLVARDVFGLTKDEMRYLLDPSAILGPECGYETFGALQRSELRQHGRFKTRDEIIDAWDSVRQDT